MLSTNKTYITHLNTKQHKVWTTIQHHFNYILFNRYYDLTANEFTILKNKFQEHHIGLFTIKKSLLSPTHNALKGQGPILILYGQQFQDVITMFTLLQDQKKVEPLSTVHQLLHVYFSITTTMFICFMALIVYSSISLNTVL